MSPQPLIAKPRPTNRLNLDAARALWACPDRQLAPPARRRVLDGRHPLLCHDRARVRAAYQNSAKIRDQAVVIRPRRPSAPPARARASTVMIDPDRGSCVRSSPRRSVLLAHRCRACRSSASPSTVDLGSPELLGGVIIVSMCPAFMGRALL